MFVEPSGQHHRPHFHVYYQNQVVVFGIEPIEIIGGALSQKEKRLVEARAELHQGELLEDWQRLQAGQLPYKIAPLR